MTRRRYTSVSVNVDVDVFDVLQDVDTVDLIAELDARAKDRSDASAKAYRALDDGLERSWQRLADLIAEGSAREALTLLHDLCPATTRTVGATLRFVEARRQH